MQLLSADLKNAKQPVSKYNYYKCVINAHVSFVYVTDIFVFQSCLFSILKSGKHSVVGIVMTQLLHLFI